jgi:hypothetical protein
VGENKLLINKRYKKENVYLPSLMMKVPDHLYVLGDTYHTCIHVTRITATHIIFTLIGCTLFTCDMYMCRLKLINDLVLSSLKMEGIRLLLLSYSTFFCFSANSVSVEVKACSSNLRFNLYCLLNSAFFCFLTASHLSVTVNGPGVTSRTCAVNMR